MNQSKTAHAVRVLFLLLGWGTVAGWLGNALGANSDAPLQFLRAPGDRFVTPSGHNIVLKGCNLGNWLLLEPWMWGGCLEGRDQTQIISTLRDRFGPERTAHLLDVYRDSDITPRDFELIKSFGFNVVRLPFHWSVVQEERPPFGIKSDGFKFLDKALKMAEDAGVYVILDLHGAPGGQSVDMPTGEVQQNKLWTSEVDQQRMAAIWQAVAERYHDRAVVAAYDLLNEPYGDFRQDLRPDLTKLMEKMYATVRKVDDRHVMFASGGLNAGVAFYGDPHAQGRHDFGFTEHYYAGLFGDNPAVESHAHVLTQTWPERAEYLHRIGAPYFVGEFNVALDKAGGAPMMREYYDRLAQLGWAGTMWSYKLYSRGGGVGRNVWYMATNAEPLPRIDLKTTPYEEIEKFFASLSSVPLAVNEPLKGELTKSNRDPLPLTQYPAVPRVAAKSSDPAGILKGWSSVDFGDSKGSTITAADGTVKICAGGKDIFGSKDSFRFVWQPGQEPCDIRASVLSLLYSSQYAKAGVMARWGERADAPFVMVNYFPDGTMAFCWRDKPGANAAEIKQAVGAALPVEVRLTVAVGKATGFYRSPGGEWQQLGTTAAPATGEFRTGLAVCSQNETGLTIARFRLAGTQDSTAPAPAEASLLRNGSFSQQNGDTESPSEWNRFGSGFSREAAADGQGALAGSEKEVPPRQPSGAWQDVKVEAGKRYTFSIDAMRDEKSDGDSKLEVRLENTMGDHQVVVNNSTIQASALPSTGSPRRLSVSGTSLNDTLRVLIILSSDKQTGSGRIKLNNAALSIAAELN